MKEYIIGHEFIEGEVEESAMAQGFLKELVRCKDCKRATDYTDEVGERPYHCRKNGGFHDGNWFCADGERSVK